MIVSVSNNISTVTGELLRLITKKGQDMTVAVVIYKDSNDDICWYGSEDLGMSDAIELLEKVKIELMKKL